MWARCAIHGPVQDATIVQGRLICSCGLECDPYEPSGFVEHEELKELAESSTQPKDAGRS